MRRWDGQRVRSVARSVAEWIGWVLLGAVFVAGIAWSASRFDERGPIANVVAGGLMIVVVMVGVAQAVILVCMVNTGKQLLFYGMGGGRLPRMLLLGFALFPLFALLAVAWLALLFV